ncbi:DUF2330 domain-containing protein [Polyangium sp. y55x31]|uniref:DUF2330 domain-containing protein n=1 Tax=Polyangium sp. y55x31 TaxID=3042688 RepID=UPI002482D064|nr:DUF2330 domain-containing protein [Polyangium sp. y55x31]MDI1478664.1 DUF2330 domain-containing protein [Polyangium sp. y55x31]
MRAAGVLAWAFVTAAASSADAFCGVYAGNATVKAESRATTVVIGRSGTRTVVSMQPDYFGPVGDDHTLTMPMLVLPVRGTVSPSGVRLLPNDLFERLDAISAPRLVESWQQDPCSYADITSIAARDEHAFAGGRPDEGATRRRPQGAHTVKIDAAYTVGDFNVLRLDTDHLGHLTGWLTDGGHSLPEGAEPVLRSYAEAGWKLLVVLIDVPKPKASDGRALLSPIRFEFDAESVGLPLRLGTLNATGMHDLVVHVLADKRYEAANFPNLTIPTNVEVDGSARARFGELYASLFDATLDENPGAFVTEYAWDAGSCDPCPGPMLSPEELRLLGAPSGMAVHTRLHARYRKEALREDLVLRDAPPIQGGRGGEGQAAVPAEVSTFQGRYLLRHRWQGPVTCPNPDFDIWGGPPSADLVSVRPAAPSSEVARGKVHLSEMLRDSVPAAGIVAKPRPDGAGGGKRFLLGFGLGAGAGLFGTIGVVLAATRSRRGSRKNSP